MKPVFNHKMPNLIGVATDKEKPQMSSWERKRGRRRKETEIRHGRADVAQSRVLWCVLGFGLL